MKIGFLGAGKVGINLARYFSEKGLDVSGFFIKTLDSKTDASFTLYQDLESFINISDVIFLTVQDDQIEDAVSGILSIGKDFKGKTFAHTSGSNSIEMLNLLKRQGATVFTFHPLQTFSSHKIDRELLEEMHIFIENDGCAPVKTIIEAIKNKHHSISSKDKSKYHCSASFVSNLTYPPI